MIIIPFSDLASFNEEITLDNIPYNIRFDYNIRFEHWSFSISTRDLIPIVSGIKLVINYSLLDQYSGRDLPLGQLFVIDTTDEIEKVSRTNIIEPLSIVYIPEDEV